jgi:hypothetical protein
MTDPAGRFELFGGSTSIVVVVEEVASGRLALG